MHGGPDGGQSLRFVLNSSSSTEAVTYDFTPAGGAWTKVEIPLGGMGAPRQVYALVWQSFAAGVQAPVYLDDIAFTNANTPPPPPQNGPALQWMPPRAGMPSARIFTGMNFMGAGAGEEAFMAEIRLPVNRWGGNATTRYNWTINASNHASDWFFENLPQDLSADAFITRNRQQQADTLLTIPMIGYVAKDDTSCGFAVSLYGAQQKTDVWRPDCGNGLAPDGAPLTGNNPLDTGLPVTPAFVTQWVQHLQASFGTAGQGGVRFYNLDNEPMLWNSTHRDVHPQPLSYDELLARTLAYAPALKAADPAALLLGPAEWGWPGYFYSALDMAAGGEWWNAPPDRLAHQNIPFIEWYLQQLAAYEQAHGVRLLDYLDEHFYPQANGVSLSPAGSAATQALRLRSTRSLWDPTYTDESWINEPVYFIPRMHAWVDNHYPGTRLAVGEYNWGALDHINGALAQADVLGIFGREGLDLATLWDPPTPAQPGAFAFRMYRNYDGAGGSFGETGVLAASADQEKLSIYAALRAADGALTVVVINKAMLPLTSTLTTAGFLPGGLRGFRYSDADLSAIQALDTAGLAAGSFTTLYPANSITVWEFAPAASLAPRMYLPLVRR